MANDDEALSRLRGSDPAMGSHPDLQALRERIAQKAPASLGADTAIRLGDDDVRGSAVRAPWIAAAAVAAIAFGAGGYALGAAQPPGNGGAVVAGQGETDDPAPGDGAVPGLMGQGQSYDSAMATASPSMEDGGAMGGEEMYDPGPVRLTAGPDLPTERGVGEVRAVVSDEDPGAFLEKWAEELSFEGISAADDAEGWFGGDGLYDPENGRMLNVYTDGGGALSFGYDDLFASPWCAENYSGMSEQDLDMTRKEWSAAFGDDVPLPDASKCKEVAGETPSKEEAISVARDFLATTGLDLSTYTLTVPDYETYGQEPSNTVMVEGWPEGQEYGQLMVNATVGPEGVINAYGTVGEMTSLGDYPLISAAEAVERYGEREFGMEYSVALMEDMAPVSTGDDMAMVTAPAFELPDPKPIKPGMDIPMLLKNKVVTGAELTRGQMWGQTSGPLEVPTWKLTTDDGMHYAVLALSEDAIEWQSWGE